eukprot:TRINITY_DN8656_c0_g1_i1.p1 TRINITY_DN8656_c0_g1~~TRINITY_DN8656_c0_g1_i1.p1  ORF type:complete len:382 (+),score=57.45 TRINITY_DN8656_c0_g1_i1:36-1181(+)
MSDAYAYNPKFPRKQKPEVHGAHPYRPNTRLQAAAGNSQPALTNRALGDDDVLFDDRGVEDALKRELVIPNPSVMPEGYNYDDLSGSVGVLFCNFPAGDHGMHRSAEQIASKFFAWRGVQGWLACHTWCGLSLRLAENRAQTPNMELVIVVVSHGGIVEVPRDDPKDTYKDKVLVFPHGDDMDYAANGVTAKAIIKAGFQCEFAKVTMLLGACKVMKGDVQLTPFVASLEVDHHRLELVTFGKDMQDNRLVGEHIPAMPRISPEMIGAAMDYWHKNGGNGFKGNLFLGGGIELDNILVGLFEDMRRSLGGREDLQRARALKRLVRVLDKWEKCVADEEKKKFIDKHNGTHEFETLKTHLFGATDQADYNLVEDYLKQLDKK